MHDRTTDVQERRKAFWVLQRSWQHLSFCRADVPPHPDVDLAEVVINVAYSVQGIIEDVLASDSRFTITDVETYAAQLRDVLAALPPDERGDFRTFIDVTLDLLEQAKRLKRVS